MLPGVYPGMDAIPGPLVSDRWLAERLGDPEIVVLDVTVHLDAPTSPHEPYDVRSGRADWEGAHVPGSRFADLVDALSAPAAPYPFTLPAPERFAGAIARLGVGDDTCVITYDTDAGMWAARLWWMLRVFGHDRTAVLDGGLTAWSAAGHPVTAEPAPAPRRMSFTHRFRPELVSGRDEVLAALEDPSVLLVNSLSSELHRGERSLYGRPGHIPGSVNVPARSLLGSEGRFRDEPGLREQFRESGALEADRVIAYCGGGISAANDALALAVLGRDDVAIYDGSLREWAGDPELPLDTG
ncbi:MAG: thiosulfate/3-mercaptopyruvate sulfurtransferase [Gaiellales bacterium]|nr:thiosulfate/3-mercaptopyruvate sulfurtransferase [Gaiellales bacterium]